MSFSGKVALVTGAGSGIGASIARRLAAEGAAVVVQDIDLDNAKTVAEEITAQGGRATPAKGNVALAEDMDLLVRNTIGWAGGLHLLVNNAGIGGPLAPIGEYPLEAWHRVIDVNLNGVFHGMRFAIPEMIRAGGGAIVNMSSILGTVGFAGAGAYVAAKHALQGLTRAAALDHAAQGIRVNAVGPAFIDTPLLDALPPGAKEALVAAHPIGRLGLPDEVAELTLFLLSDKARFITGSYHLIDGGYTAQ